jgi:hypothetical protein
MADLLGVMMLLSLVLWFVSPEESFWLWCFLGSAVGLIMCPTPEERDIRRQVRKVERVRRERERLLQEMSWRDRQQRQHGRGEWL